MEKKSVKNIKEALHTVILGYKAYGAANEDGKIDLNDLAQLLPVLASLQAGIEGAKEIPDEFKDIDAEEAVELSTFVIVTLGDDVKPRVEKIINSSLKIIVAGFELVEAIKGEEEA